MYSFFYSPSQFFYVTEANPKEWGLKVYVEDSALVFDAESQKLIPKNGD